ncbi:chaperonin 10-like protein [Dichotomocladium elegans]|nr:chaperonin 10-like protein [Dichotomocladium elegans]
MTPALMKVASWERKGAIEMIEREVPTIGPGQILVRVTASGICGTDLHICKGETPHASPKVTIGHEFAGIVESIHPGTSTAVSVGDIVAVDPNVPCHACTFCRNKKYHLCPYLKCIGVSVNGGMAKYVAVPATAVFSVPASVGPVTACLAEPLSCVVHAVDMGSIKTGDSVLVIGAGPIGLMVVALSMLSGGRVTVVEPNAMRRTKATSFGAAQVFAPEEFTVGDPCMGYGFDVVFECVGLPETMSKALNSAKAGATVVWVGVAKPDTEVAVSPFNIYRRELTLKSTYTNPFGMERAIKILEENKVDWANLISHSYALNDFHKAWDVFLSGAGLKICIRPNLG